MMTRPGSLRLLPLGLLLATVAACDDGTAPDDALGGLDPDAVSAATDAPYALITASADADFLLTGFRNAVSPGLDLPDDALGRTFVWDPEGEGWVDDPGRTDAPAGGVRVVWYATDDIGDIQVPLVELGHIDLTDEDAGTRDRLGVVIVRTDGATDTLADYVYGQAIDDDGTTRTEQIELLGFFADGTERVDVDIRLEENRTLATGDEAYSVEALFETPQGAYEWQLEGTEAAGTGIYEETLDATVRVDGRSTALVLDRTGDGTTENGSGTLSHDGAAIADLTITGDAYAFTRPGGGSFSARHASDLETVVARMSLGAPLLLITLPFITL